MLKVGSYWRATVLRFLVSHLSTMIRGRHDQERTSCLRVDQSLVMALKTSYAQSSLALTLRVVTVHRLLLLLLRAMGEASRYPKGCQISGGKMSGDGSMRLV